MPSGIVVNSGGVEVSSAGVIVGTCNCCNCPAPTGLAAIAGGGGITLNWTPSAGALGYNVFRGTTAGGESATPIASGGGTSLFDAAVVSGTMYYYYVRAVCIGGESPPSNEASATAI